MKNLLKSVSARLKTLTRKLIRNKWPSDEEVIYAFRSRNELDIINRIKGKESINVAFFCISVSLWKYDSLFRYMQKDPLFHPIFFISPRYDKYSVRRKEVSEMVEYCKNNNYDFINLRSNILYKGQDIRRFNVDIAFYSQPYSRICPHSYYYDKLKDSLLCYVPYGYLISKMKHNYVSLLNEIAWKVYMPTSESKRTASLFVSDTSNIEDLGYPGYDMYLECKGYHWKKDGLKRIIWAPHYSIRKNDWIHLSSFLDICDFMIEMAKKYKDQVQFVFKPHPHLYPSLCKEWGEKRAKEYYEKWNRMENTSLCEGDGYPVFKTSDALIHDCASYLLDYIYTQKPCLYVSFSGKLNVEAAEDGKDAYNAHYHAKTEFDIECFIQQVVIDGEDSMQSQRKDVLLNHILPKKGKSATENIIDSIKEIL